LAVDRASLRGPPQEKAPTGGRAILLGLQLETPRPKVALSPDRAENEDRTNLLAIRWRSGARFGIVAATLNSANDRSDNRDALPRLACNTLRLLYIAPKHSVKTGSSVFPDALAAQKAMSAIVRSDARFATERLTKILIGDTSAAVAKFGQQRLPTFGVGKEHGGRKWRSIFRQPHGAGVRGSALLHARSLYVSNAPILRERGFWGRGLREFQVPLKPSPD
jgi:superfamily II DNA helicase RecQ